MFLKYKKITYYNNYYNLNLKSNLNSFFNNKTINLKKNYNFFFKSIYNLLLYNKIYTKISLIDYYLYTIKKNYIYINIINRRNGSIKLLTYQYIYPSWMKLYITGNLINIKKNIFSTKLIVSNYIDNFYIKRYFFLYSPLFIIIYNQEQKKLITKIKSFKNKENFLNKHSFADFVYQLKSAKLCLFKKFSLLKKKEKKKNLWKKIWLKKFKHNIYWIKKYPYNLIKKKLYNVIFNKNIYIF